MPADRAPVSMNGNILFQVFPLFFAVVRSLPLPVSASIERDSLLLGNRHSIERDNFLFFFLAMRGQLIGVESG